MNNHFHLVYLGIFSLVMIRDVIKLDFTIFIVLIPVALVWLVFGEQKKLVILLNISLINSMILLVSAVLGYFPNLVSS